MKRILLALAIAGSAALPALAQNAMMSADTMTCADYTGLDHDGMMQAMQTLDAGMSADDQMKSGQMLNDTCKDHPDMMVGDAMKMMK
jgi:hypothetical protein